MASGLRSTREYKKWVGALKARIQSAQIGEVEGGDKKNKQIGNVTQMTELGGYNVLIINKF